MGPNGLWGVFKWYFVQYSLNYIGVVTARCEQPIRQKFPFLAMFQPPTAISMLHHTHRESID